METTVKSNDEILKVKYLKLFDNFRDKIENDINMSQKIRSGLFGYSFIISRETDFELRSINNFLKYHEQGNRLFGRNIIVDYNKNGYYFKTVLQFMEN